MVENLNEDIERLDETNINFERPHDIGPYDGYSDIIITDTIYKDQVTTSTDYIEKKQIDNGGTLETYTSPKGVEYKVWNVENYGYEAQYTFFVTDYKNDDGYHIVEISTFRSDFEENTKKLKPIVDSIGFSQQ
jgi:hypothetical protein